ncbi:MAG: glycosyltransferase family 4 protein [Planctomycetes bacterium]|nr:glycosyltransferase family 4 protein [Planctomycetota bacterium]
MLKIVHIITRLIVGGAQENTILTCREQARLGHDVTLLAGPPEGPEGSLVDAARAAGIRTVLVPPLVRPVRPWHDLEAYADLAKHLRDIRPDVVHTHSSKAGILGRLAARRTGAACIVHTIHGLPFDEYQGCAARWAYREAERRAARWSHRLIAVSRDMADRAAAAGLAPRGAVAVIYSGMDTERFRAAAGQREAVRQEWGAGPGDFVLLKVARLFHLKGHEFVLPAFAEVLRRCPRAMLVLAGGGILRPQLEALAARLGAAARVRFIGLVPPERMPAVLWAADAVVHAGLREGLARVLPQAGLCRRPAVAYDVGGAREVVRDGENGFLLAPPSPHDVARPACPAVTVRRFSAPAPCGTAGLSGRGEAAPMLPTAGQAARGTAVCGSPAEAMERLASDPAAACRMGERWPEEVLARFDYRPATREIMRVYDSARGV